MLRILLILLLIVITQNTNILPAYSENVIGSENFSVNIPQAITINGIGVSPQIQKHGLPGNSITSFNLIVNPSPDGKSWQLTTEEPVGVSISYNTAGSILAVFVSMKRLGDNTEISPEMISIYPSKVIFDTGPGGGDSLRIFHFNPIITVSKETPPGAYIGKITFTVLAEQ